MYYLECIWVYRRWHDALFSALLEEEARAETGDEDAEPTIEADAPYRLKAREGVI